MISIEEVLKFQEEWGSGIVNISKAFQKGADFKLETNQFISKLYAYGSEKVLFKPTLASDTQFRLDRQAALSYFIGGNTDYPEDTGFAIKGWSSVRWENAGIKIMKDCAICMGNYFFSLQNEDDLKVEYSIILRKIDGMLKIILHDSHLPYQK